MDKVQLSSTSRLNYSDPDRNLSMQSNDDHSSSGTWIHHPRSRLWCCLNLLLRSLALGCKQRVNLITSLNGVRGLGFTLALLLLCPGYCISILWRRCGVDLDRCRGDAGSLSSSRPLLVREMVYDTELRVTPFIRPTLKQMKIQLARKEPPILRR